MQAARRFITQWLCAALMVLTNVGLFSLVMGCSPVTVHVVSADAAAFQLWLHDGMASDARRPAHLMQSYVRGKLPEKAGNLEDARLPEAYSTNVGPSIRAAEYHLAYAAERLIREHYAATHLQMPTLETNHLLELVDEAGGNTHIVHDFNRDLPVDIGDAHARVMFEVVPPGQSHLEAAKERVAFKQRLLNYAMIGVPKFNLGTDYHGEIGVRFGENAPLVKLAWVTTAPGIVQYQWRALQAEERSEDACGEAYMAGRWRELAPEEIARFARALHEVVERLVQAREELGRTRAAVEIPMLPGTTYEDYIRSVAWWSAVNDETAQLLPVMRRPPLPPAPVRRDARFVGQTVGGGGVQSGSTVQVNISGRIDVVHSTPIKNLPSIAAEGLKPGDRGWWLGKGIYFNTPQIPFASLGLVSFVKDGLQPEDSVVLGTEVDTTGFKRIDWASWQKVENTFAEQVGRESVTDPTLPETLWTKNRIRGRGKAWIEAQTQARVRTYWNDQLKNYPGAILDFEGEGADHGPVLLVRDASRIRAKYDILGTVEAMGKRFRINTSVRAFTFNAGKGLALGLAYQFVPGLAEAIQFVRLGGVAVTYIKVLQVLGRMPTPLGVPPVPPAASPPAPSAAPAAPSTPPASGLGAIVGGLGGRLITIFPPVPLSIIEPTPKEN